MGPVAGTLRATPPLSSTYVRFEWQLLREELGLKRKASNLSWLIANNDRDSAPIRYPAAQRHSRSLQPPRCVLCLCDSVQFSENPCSATEIDLQPPFSDKGDDGL